MSDGSLSVCGLISEDSTQEPVAVVQEEYLFSNPTPPPKNVKITHLEINSWSITQGYLGDRCYVLMLAHGKCSTTYQGYIGNKTLPACSLSAAVLEEVVVCLTLNRSCAGTGGYFSSICIFNALSPILLYNINFQSHCQRLIKVMSAYY